MEKQVPEEVIKYISDLAKLELTGQEKERAGQDMEVMLGFVNKLLELDTSGVEPMSHLFPMHHVFREDAVVNGDVREDMLRNAPEQQDGAFLVPGTLSEGESDGGKGV